MLLLVVVVGVMMMVLLPPRAVAGLRPKRCRCLVSDLCGVCVCVEGGNGEKLLGVREEGRE